KDFFTKIVGGPLPPQVDSSLAVTYTIKVNDIMAEEEFLAAREVFIKKRESKILDRDTKEINEFLTESNVTAEQDTSGLQYIIHSNTGGKKPSLDDCVEVKYKGTFLKTGEIFDQQEMVSFPLNGVITGWKLAIPMLGKGDSGTFYIPSKLA